ncbi:MAG TPA: GldG family protein, partial [Verrucomicrobiae bacterium]|nr:GldG family protein [Verrucomicrobiae bacterium]
MFARLEDFRYARWIKRLNRTTQIVLALLLVVGMNYVAARHFKRWDLTPNKRYSLSAETLARLDQDPVLRGDKDTPLQLIFVVQQDQLNNDSRVMVNRVNTLLKEYEYAAANLPGGKIPLKVEYVDPVRQTTRVKQLDQYSALPLTNPDNLPQLIVLHGKRAHALLKSDMYGTTYNGEATDFRGENAITSAILDVVGTKTEAIYFTTGHGEANTLDTQSAGLSAFRDALRQENYEVNTLNLGSEGLVPEDAKVVVIVNPTVPFEPAEAGKLRRYLNDKNGRILLFLSPHAGGYTHLHSGLEPFLQEWGIESPNLMILEGDPRRRTMENF